MKKIPLFARFLIVVFIVAITFVFVSAWKEMQRSKGIESEVAKLRAEAERIRNENRSLTERIAYFSTDSFEEREAKEKLGWKKNDEEAIAVDVERFEGATETEDGMIPEPQGPEPPNYEKWRFYFFGENQ